MSYFYLATPYASYAGGNLEEAHSAACRLAARLLDAGWPIFCPIAHTHEIAKLLFDPRSHDFWIDIVDMPLMHSARLGMLIGMLPGWKKSEGIRREREWFEQAGRPIIEIDPNAEIDKYRPKEDGKWMR